MLLVETPDTRAIERDYTLGVVLGELLSLPWRSRATDRNDVRITFEGKDGELLLPDVFFSCRESEWLQPASMPRRPLANWRLSKDQFEALTVSDDLPIIYGDGKGSLRQKTNSLCLPIDIFGSVFFMLSRYEEMVTTDRDEHDRFPAKASLAFKEGFLNRPIVDEYLEVLWSALRSLWPNLKRKTQTFRMRVSCDVDHPFTYDGKLKRCLRRVGGDLLHRRSPGLAMNALVGTWEARKDVYDRDPYRKNLGFIMDENEKAGNQVAFYFIPEKTHPTRDQSASLTEPRMRQLLREIHSRGHEIGIHPGYTTYDSQHAIQMSVDMLRNTMADEGINQAELGGRQHYLRWRNPSTARLLDECGIDYDSTLGFADHAGFRCGTCREFPLYDLQMRRPLRLRERPLIVMENSVFANKYMGVQEKGKALAIMTNLRRVCDQFSGDFTLLWHNSELIMKPWREMYLKIIA